MSTIKGLTGYGNKRSLDTDLKTEEKVLLST